MKKALALIAYSRFSYFELVLPSILNQQIHGKPITDFYDIYIFQDGLWSQGTEEHVQGHKKISDYLEELPKHIQVIKQPSNLSIALHFDFIERFFFLEKKYDFAMFCEDDLILGPGYLHAMELLANKFRGDHRVGMLSAIPCNSMRPLEEQRAHQGEFAHMEHNWGFGLFRDFWIKRQPFVDCYLALLKTMTYQKRVEPVIFEWLKRAGFNPLASSQDHIKGCATFGLGAIRLATFANFGVPIGRNGFHSDIFSFKEKGLDKVVCFDALLSDLEDLSQEKFEKLYAEQADFCEPLFLNHEQWEKRLQAGELDPEYLLDNSIYIPQQNNNPMLTKEHVIWCYRAILGREPESEEVIAQKITFKDFTQLRRSFFQSAEFRLQLPKEPMPKIFNAYVPLTLPTNNVEMESNNDELIACINKVKRAWSHLGIVKPHYSVLTNQHFLPENFAKHENEFWMSGEEEAGHLQEILSNYTDADFSSKKIIEYGCGVGRVTLGLTKHFAEVHAYDISEGHLEIAKEKALQKENSRCHFHLCSDELLEPLAQCDYFYSRIVFQHNPPPLIRHLIKKALAALLPDGIAVFQVPTYIKNYSFNTSLWLAADHSLEMQMHALPQSFIFELIKEENCQLLQLREDGSTGDPERYISNTFIIQKRNNS